MASSYELTNDFLLVSYIPNHFHLKFCHEPQPAFQNHNFCREQHVLLESLEIVTQITLGAIVSQVQCHVRLS